MMMTFELYSKIIRSGSVYHEGDKLYTQIALDDCLYKLDE